MIFVTVGNAKQPFMRLLEAMERLAGEGAFSGEDVFVQSGTARGFAPIHCGHVAFLQPEEFETRIQTATMIVCHAGAGTLLHAFEAGKTPVVMPRAKRYGELIDDHQTELTQVLAAECRIIPAYEVSELPGAIAEARRYRAEVKIQAPRLALDLVMEAVENIVGRRDTVAS